MGARRATKPSTGPRRRGAERPKLLVYDILVIMCMVRLLNGYIFVDSPIKWLYFCQLYFVTYIFLCYIFQGQIITAHHFLGVLA